eukprot:CAMPEP_0184016534 /NCGR_PEP_ID=MMETSP0954-20121128/6982_1 /TAXON_ID=627963 /ORGANISM="Aplanochytrium sp, Strain PBS07" /LENGTH=153 /DNA_ID=CAMNT_0026297565 /DNA_START=212 /DNA_END=673 /DNA_ORIENTATION=-
MAQSESNALGSNQRPSKTKSLLQQVSKIRDTGEHQVEYLLNKLRNCEYNLAVKLEVEDSLDAGKEAAREYRKLRRFNLRRKFLGPNEDERLLDSFFENKNVLADDLVSQWRRSLDNACERFLEESSEEKRSKATEACSTLRTYVEKALETALD